MYLWKLHFLILKHHPDSPFPGRCPTCQFKAGKKLDYMHYNPLQPHWQLCNDPVRYRFSSAKFYEMEEDEFKILTHYMDKLWKLNLQVGHLPGNRKSKIAREGEINISSLRDLFSVLGVCAINRVPLRGYLYNSNCYFFPCSRRCWFSRRYCQNNSSNITYSGWADLYFMLMLRVANFAVGNYDDLFRF
jgi:hypothetical protein